MRIRQFPVRAVEIIVAFALVLVLVAVVARATTPSVAAGSITNIKSLVGNPATLGTNETVTYQIDLACSSNTDDCGETVVTDILPAEVEFVSLDAGGAPGWTGTESGGTVTFTKGPGVNFTDGESVQFFITVRVRPGSIEGIGPVSNTATTTSNNGTSDSSSTPVVTPIDNEPQWAPQKSQVSPGSGIDPASDTDVTYRVAFCGPVAGNEPLVDMVLVDTFPAGASVVDANGGIVSGNTITWTLPPVSQADLNAAAAAGDTEYCHEFNPVLNFGSGAFPDGTDIDNTAAGVDGPAAGDGTGVCPDPCEVTISATVVEPDPRVSVSKWGDPSISDDGILTYSLQFLTTASNVGIDAPVLTDIAPDGMRITGFQVDPSYDFGVETDVSINGGSSWTTVDDMAPSPPPPPWPSDVEYTQSDLDAALSGTDVVVDAIRFRYYQMVGGAKVYTMPPGARSDHEVYMVTDRDDPPAIGETIENCASASTASTTPAGAAVSGSSCAESEVTEDLTSFYTSKWTDPDEVVPGEEHRVVLRLYVDSNNALPIVDPVFFDLLPEGFEYVRYDSTYTGGSSEIGTAPDPNVEIIEDYNGTGRDLIRFSYSATPPADSTAVDGVSPPVANPFTIDYTRDDRIPDDSMWDRRIEVRFYVMPSFGTPVGEYENLAGASTAAPNVGYCNGWNSDSATDTDDLDGDGVTTDITCVSTDETDVLPAASLAGYKWDDGLDGLDHVNTLSTPPAPDVTCPVYGPDTGFTRYPCAAQTLPGETFPYKLEIFNQGNTDLNDYWMYDILPHVGDVGVNEALAGSPRNSEWSVQLAGPVTLGALPGGNTVFTIEYSDSTDPCRDEMANPGTATPWPAGCDDDWTATPDNWLDVKAFRINIPFDVAPFAGGESFVLDIPAIVPPGTPFDSVSWNSIAHRATNSETGADLLPAAPRIAGIRIPPVDSLDSSTFPFDQALIKTLDIPGSPDLADGLNVGDEITFLIELANQGRAIQTIEFADYVNNLFFESFDPALNPAGTVTDSGDGDSFSYSWTTAPPYDTFTPNARITADSGDLEFGESITVPVTLVVSSAWEGGAIQNWAEITNFDDDTDSGNGDENSGALSDEDSTPDAIFGNDNRPEGPGSSGDDFVGGDGDPTGDPDPMANDEDDHDVAGIPAWDLSLIKTLGTGQTFTIDTSTTPPTVVWALTVKNQGDLDTYSIEVTEQIPTGMRWDSFDGVTAGTAVVTSTAAVDDTGTVTFAIDHLEAAEQVTFEFTMEVTDQTLGEYVNVAEISDFDDDDNPNNADHPLLGDVDSTPDSTLDDDIVTDPGTDPAGNDDRNSHNDIDYDPDDDGNVNETTPGDEDDHDAELVVMPFDLALQKTFDQTSGAPLQPGSSTVTFDLTLTNQGRDVQTISVVDYIDTALWDVFDATLNPDSDGSTTAHAVDSGDGDEFSYAWDATDPANPVLTLTATDGTDGQFDWMETLTVPITLTIDADWDGTTLINWAEISNFDNDTDSDNGDAVTPDASGDTLVDTDSTPDTTFGDDNRPTGPGADGDDTITGDGDGVDPIADDEDDHDVAGLPVWDLALVKELADGQTFVVDPDGALTVDWEITVKNQGMLDAFFIDVTDTLPTGMEFTALGPVTAGTAAVSTTDPAGTTGVVTFQIDELEPAESVSFELTTTITDLAQAEYLNIAEISAFDDDDDDTNAANPDAVDIDSTPNANPLDDAIDTSEDVDPNSNDDRNSHNDVDHDADDDGNLNEPSVTDEDDHDAELVVVPYDLALAKTVDTVATTFPLAPGSPVTFLITVTNQGRGVEDFTVVDYIDTDVWEVFDPTANPDGDTTGSVTLPYEWNDADTANPVVSIDGALAPTQFVVIPITLTLRSDHSATSGTPLENWAEIASFDNDGDPDTPAPTDRDSTPDDDQLDDNQPAGAGEDGDDVITGDGDGVDPVDDDEDDHDVAGIEIFDLALRKTLNDSTELPVVHGATVTFDITIFNQGSVHATNPTIIDGVDLTMWEAFDAAANPDGTTTGDATLPYVWTEAGTDGSVAITGTLAPGESLTVPVTLTIAAGSDLANLVNIAEISSADPTEADGTTPVTYPDGSPLTDIDSTPNTDVTDDNQPANPGDSTDDVTDNSPDRDGAPDEDDHDIATVTPPTYSLGNQVWFDPNDDGMIGTDEDGVPGVVVELWTDPDGDGVPDVLVDTTTTDADGLYLFDGLEPGDYVVVLPAGNFDEDGPLDGWWSSTPTSTDPNDDVDSDDNGIDNGIADGGTVSSGTVEVGPNSPTGENPDNDPNTPDGHEQLTVDFGFTQYSLGNQVWLDDDNDGMIDASETPIAGVEVLLFTDADGDGEPDDRDGDGDVDADDAIATDVTDANGLYLFDELAPGDYVVGIAADNWLDGGPLEDLLSSDPTSDDPNDDTDNDDNGIADPSLGFVISGPVTIGAASEPTGEDPDNDLTTPDANENLTVDFGFWEPVFDLALRKQLADGTDSADVEMDDLVTFTLTVFNQGNVTATEIELVDYLPAGLVLADADWTLESNGSVTTVLPGSLAAGESTTVDITVRVIGDDLDNTAEIVAALPVGPSGDPLVDPIGQPITDIDSVPDALDNENAIDNEISGGSGDEDDHDIARLRLSSGQLPFTGGNTGLALLAALIATVGGGVLVLLGWRRRSIDGSIR